MMLKRAGILNMLLCQHPGFRKEVLKNEQN